MTTIRAFLTNRTAKRADRTRHRTASREHVAYTDNELLSAVAGSDHAAFVMLYDRQLGLVRTNVLRVLCDPTLIDTVVEEIFVTVLRRAPRFDPTRDSAQAWILGIAHDTAIQRRVSGPHEIQADIQMRPSEPAGVGGDMVD